MCGTRINTPLTLILLRFLLKIAILIYLTIFRNIKNLAIFPIRIIKIKHIHIKVIITFFENGNGGNAFFVFSSASWFWTFLLVFGEFIKLWQVFVYFYGFGQLQDLFVDLGLLLLFLFVLDKFFDATLAFWRKLSHTQIIFLLWRSLHNLLHTFQTTRFMH